MTRTKWGRVGAVALWFAMFAVVGAVRVSASDLIVLHTNDIHGRLEINEEAGQMGLPFIASVVEDFRSRYENVLVLDAGDTIHGRPITNVLRGETAVSIMGEIGYDVMSPGNHDFNFGYTRLLELEETMIPEYISANVYKDGEPILKPYTLRQVGDYTVAVFGLTPTYTVGVVRAELIAGLEFRDALETAQYYGRYLRDEYDVDLVVALANSSSADEVVRHVENVDLFVNGRAHRLHPEGEWYGDMLHVKAKQYTEYIGIVEINFGDRLDMSARVMSAAEVMAAYEVDDHAQSRLDEFREEASRIRLGR